MVGLFALGYRLGGRVVCVMGISWWGIHRKSAWGNNRWGNNGKSTWGIDGCGNNRTCVWGINRSDVQNCVVKHFGTPVVGNVVDISDVFTQKVSMWRRFIGWAGKGYIDGAGPQEPAEMIPQGLPGRKRG